MELTSSAAILLAGWLIGATGIGGVLVVPALNLLEGVDLPRAIAASALAFALPGMVALRRLRGMPAGQRGHALVVGALPGALIGALLVHHVDVRWLFGGMAALALASGLRGLLPQAPLLQDRNALPTAAALALGLLVGLGSGVTGTGGPVLLVPLLLILRQPLMYSVAAAQAIQLPVALCAGATHLVLGALDIKLALVLGVLLLVGAVAGQWAAQRLKVRLLQRLVSGLLLVSGGWFAWRVLG